ncbi:MAG: SDR family oxidoreductase [Balneola sp.]
MNVLIVGANGGIGRILSKQLSDQQGMSPIAMIRKENQKTYFDDIGVETTMGDLEDSVDGLANAFSGADAIVFTAGSGGKTDYDKTLEIDLDAAVKCIEASEKERIKRFVMVSVISADNRDAWNSSPIKPYMIAKHYADRALKNSKLDYTIVRPGGLTDNPGNGTITTAPSSSSESKIPREDVVSTILECLNNEKSKNKILEIVSGETTIKEAVNAL